MATVKKISTTRWYWPDPERPDGRREAKANAPGAVKVREEGNLYYVVFKENGKKKCVSTGRSDKRAAQQFLADFVKAKERGEAGITDPRKTALDTPISQHVESYLATLKDRSETHQREVTRVLGLATTGMQSLRGFTVAAIERHLQTSPSAATANKHRVYLSGFCNYCFRLDYVVINPIARVARRIPGAAEPASRIRRAYTIDELRRLLAAARNYPLDARGEAKGGRPRADGTPARTTKPTAELTDAYRETLESSGKERELVYRLHLATGLRRGELSRVTVGMFDGVTITAPKSFLKHRPKQVTHVIFHLPPALATELTKSIVAAKKGAKSKLVMVPCHSNYIKQHKARLGMARIDYETEEGFGDIHAFRTTTNMYLKKNGVALHDRQRYLRHSPGDITTKHYDPENKRPETTGQEVQDLLTALDAVVTSTTA